MHSAKAMGMEDIWSVYDRFCESLMSARDIDAFRQIFIEQIGSLMPDVNTFAMWIYNAESKIYDQIVSPGFENQIPDLPDTKLLHVFRLKYDRGTEFLYRNVNDRDATTKILKLHPAISAGSELMVPARYQGVTRGLLYLLNEKTGAFDETKRRQAIVYANCCLRSWQWFLKKQPTDIPDLRHSLTDLPFVKLYESLPLNLYTIDSSGRYLYMNEHACNLIGTTLEAVVGKRSQDIFLPELVTQLDELDRLTWTTGKAQRKIVTATVKSRTVHMVAGRQLINAENGDKILLGYSLDMSEPLAKRFYLAYQQEFIQKIIDTIPNYIYVKDRNSKFVMVNQAVADLFGTTKEEILSKGNEFLEHHPVSVVLDNESDKQVIEQNITLESEERMTLSDGEVRWVNTTKKPLILSDGEINVLGVSVDITPIKQHAEALEDAKKVKEQFLANISHEIRTPINGIVGMIKMLESSPTLPDQVKYLDAIRKSSETLQVLISDILDFSIIESGNLRFDRIGFKPKPLLNALIDSFRYAANEKGIHLTLNYDPYVDEVLIGDPVRLNQILLNLLGNAVKFTQKGYVRVYVLKKNESVEKAQLEFIVEDSGIGIDEKSIHRIFDSFEQANIKITRNYGGTGLGLSIVRQLVQLQSGQITVDSKIGSGTRFTIDLEYDIGSERDLEIQQGSENNEQANTEREYLRGKRLLVVEDNEVNLLYSKMLLERWHCIVETAPNGLVALDRFKEHDFDMILMDVLMPVMNGYEATRFIRSQFKPPKSRTKIIAITANALQNDIDKYREAGVNDCLAKPYTPEELKAVILKHLGVPGHPAEDVPFEMDKPIIDLSYLEKISGNDPIFIEEMVRSFINESPKDLRNMERAHAQKEWKSISELAHKMKPSLTFMGMNQTMELLNELRDAAREQDEDQTLKLMQKLDGAINKAIKDLEHNNIGRM